MKKLLLLSLLIFSTYLNAQAQKIHFTDTSNKWTIENGCLCDPTIVYPMYQYEGDSLVGGVIYKKLVAGQPIWFSNCFPGLVREDTIQKKVYFRGYDSLSYATEQLLYNYNWIIGDTVKAKYGQYQSYVSAIDSVNISGYWYKVWHFSVDHQKTVGLFSDYTIIEGIGSSEYLFYPLMPFEFEAGRVVRCFSHNGIKPPIVPAVNGFDNVTSCAKILEVKTFPTLGQNISIVPVPADKTARINFAVKIAIGKITIYNIAGQQVFHKQLANASNVDIGEALLIPGTYYYVIADNKLSTTYRGYFVFNN